MIKILILLRFIFAIMVSATPILSHSATYNVGSYAEFESAVNAANENVDLDIINITQSFYLAAPADMSPSLRVVSAIEIEGNGFSLSREPGDESNYSFLWVSSGADVTIRNLEISGCRGGHDQGIGGVFFVGGFPSASLILDHVTLTGNSATRGGAIAVDHEAEVRIYNSVISNNHTTQAGGGIQISSNSVRIENTSIRDNTTNGFGGGIHLLNFPGSSEVVLLNSVVFRNHGEAGGGGISVFGGSSRNASRIVSNGSRIELNTTGPNSPGGGLYLNANGGGGTTELQNTSIRFNKAHLGGGIFADTESGFFIQQSTIAQNEATGSGGGLYAAELRRSTILNSTISGNSAGTTTGIDTTGYGGGAYVSGILNFFNSTLSGNTAFNSAGAIWLSEDDGVNSTLTFNNTTLMSNRASGRSLPFGVIESDGVYIDAGHLEMSNSIIAGSNGVDSFDCLMSNENSTVQASIFNIIQFDGCSTNAVNEDPMLGPLQDNGGPTLTHAPLENAVHVLDQGDISSRYCQFSDQRLVARNGISCHLGSTETISREIDDSFMFPIVTKDGKVVIINL